MKAYGFIEDPEMITHFLTTLGILSVMMPYHKWAQQSHRHTGLDELPGNSKARVRFGRLLKLIDTQCDGLVIR